MTTPLCLSGILQLAPPVDIIQRGQYRLFGANNQLLATLVTSQNLNSFVGQLVTVCGFSEGFIEGVLSLRVVHVFLGYKPPKQDSSFFCQYKCKKYKCKKYKC